uniref:Uncharacterized protein n=1 Tax=viral metagenome TaxID=1070528 RepID=A0A6H2A2A0_9ZZZZ
MMWLFFIFTQSHIAWKDKYFHELPKAFQDLWYSSRHEFGIPAYFRLGFWMHEA